MSRAEICIKFADNEAEIDALGESRCRIVRLVDTQRRRETEINSMEFDLRVWRTLLELSDPRGATAGSASPGLSSVQYQQLLAMARVHGVLGIVLRNLGSPCAGNEDVWRIAQRQWQAQLAKSLLLRRHGQELIEGLADAGIPAVTFKGADFADHLYPRSGLRTMNDIDVLVPRECWTQTATALEQLGYVRDIVPPMRFPAAEYGEESWRLRSNPAIECDLHWNLINHPSQRRRASVEFADLDWEAEGKLDSAGRRATPASRLVIAAAHAAITHQFDRLVLLCDLREICRQLTGEIEFARLRARRAHGNTRRDGRGAGRDRSRAK